MGYLGLTMLKYNLSLGLVDSVMVMLSKLFYGDLTKYRIPKPPQGPFFMKATYGKYPVIDVGTVNMIKSGHIQVLPAIKGIRGNDVLFEDGESHSVDSIIFCTGFKTSTNLWLKGGDCSLLNEDGLAKASSNHWKGKNGLYCVGLSRNDLHGAAGDALNIANHINSLL